MKRHLHKAGFILRFRYTSSVVGKLRAKWFSFLGMEVGKKTVLPRISVTWPHQVSIGNKCVLESYIRFKYDGIWKPGPSIKIGNEVFIGSNCEFNIKKGIRVGDNSNIASGCRFIDHDHGMEAGKLMGPQRGVEKSITIGCDVWLGCNVVVLKGAEIADGAIVGAGSVVTKSIAANEIWAGVPARKIGERK